MRARHQPLDESQYVVVPVLVVSNAARAIEFYRQAFGATELERYLDANGGVEHAEIRVGSSRLIVRDDILGGDARCPRVMGGSPVSITLFVEDVEAAAQKALASGAILLRPLKTQKHGGRSGTFVDPFGHTWILSSNQRDSSRSTPASPNSMTGCRP